MLFAVEFISLSAATVLFPPTVVTAFPPTEVRTFPPNELYCGRVTWNRACTLRDPDTGARVRRVKPETEWQRGEVPQLRIVDDETFEVAQRRRARRSLQGRHGRMRPKRILSGLLRCGICGAGMSKKDTDHGRPRLICTQRREAGACSHRLLG